jgi:hypothetical protein
MTMKIRLLSVLLILLVTNPLVSYSQFFKRPSKKVLLRQVDSLLKRTDSLEQALLGFQIPVNDSILLENEINEGGFEANGDEFYYGDDSLSTEQKISIYYHQNALNRMELVVTPWKLLIRYSIHRVFPIRSIFKAFGHEFFH